MKNKIDRLMQNKEKSLEVIKVTKQRLMKQQTWMEKPTN